MCAVASLDLLGGNIDPNRCPYRSRCRCRFRGAEVRFEQQSVRVTKRVRVTTLQSAKASVFGGRDHLCEHADDSVQSGERWFEEVGIGLPVALDDEQLGSSFEG